jgi:hypothetical protein
MEFSPDFKRQHTEIEKAFPKFIARFRIGQIERDEQLRGRAPRKSSALPLQIAQLIEKIGADFRGVLDQIFLFDDAQIMRRAHHVGEISAPG